MADVRQQDKQQVDVVGQVQNSFPSDDELQDTKKKRQDFIQNNIVQKLRDKGFPELGENLGAAAMTANDMITPDTREQYMQGLSVPAVGSVENQAAREIAPTFAEGVAKGETGAGASNFSKWVKGEPQMPGSNSAINSGKDVAIGAEQMTPSTAGSTWKKPGTANSSNIKELQSQYQDAASQGTREGDQQASDLLDKIRKMRDARME